MLLMLAKHFWVQDLTCVCKTLDYVHFWVQHTTFLSVTHHVSVCNTLQCRDSHLSWGVSETSTIEWVLAPVSCRWTTSSGMRLASAKAPFYGTERRQMAMHLHAVAALTGEVPMYWSLRASAATVCYVPAQSTTVVAVQSTWDADVSETPTPRWYCRKSSRSFQRPCNTAF